MLTERIAAWGNVSFRPPASAEHLRACESALGHALPDDLRDVLAETDGVVDRQAYLGLVWTAERIGGDNAEFRSNHVFAELYMPFDPLVFFSDGGDGDQFAVSLHGNRDIYRWDHETDSRIWVASTVLDFIERSLTGTLTG